MIGHIWRGADRCRSAPRPAKAGRGRRPKAGGRGAGAAIGRDGPERWVTDQTGKMGNTLSLGVGVCCSELLDRRRDNRQVATGVIQESEPDLAEVHEPGVGLDLL